MSNERDNSVFSGLYGYLLDRQGLSVPVDHNSAPVDGVLDSEHPATSHSEPSSKGPSPLQPDRRSGYCGDLHGVVRCDGSCPVCCRTRRPTLGLPEAHNPDNDPNLFSRVILPQYNIQMAATRGDVVLLRTFPIKERMRFIDYCMTRIFEVTAMPPQKWDDSNINSMGEWNARAHWVLISLGWGEWKEVEDVIQF